MLVKYSMIIDGEPHKALFLDHLEAADFIDSTEREENAEIIVLGYKAVTPSEIIADDDFTEEYKRESLCVSRDYRKGRRLID